MFRNYLIIALRNLVRHKLYSGINIAGLAVGLACAVFIALFVWDELSYDRWIPGSNSLYRLEVTFHVPGGGEIVTDQAPIPIPPVMRDQIPEVRAFTRLSDEWMTMIAGDRRFKERVAVVDANFLKLIRLPMAAGDPASALAQPESVVLSQSMARKYFGDANPIGKTLSTNRSTCFGVSGATIPLKVTGVIRDLPHNTQLAADMLVPNTSVAERVCPWDKQNWVATPSANTYAYLALAPGADPAVVLAKLKPILDRYVDISAFTDVRIPGSRIEDYRLTRFVDVHLRSDKYGGMRPGGDWTTLYGLGVIGALILAVACVNFTNLASARAAVRAREISLRKCMGAGRGQLIVQFLGESVLLSLLALVLALALVEILLPTFGGFMQRPLTLDYAVDLPLLIGAFAVAICAGLASGIYPALVLSGFRPAATLRANRSGQAGSGRLRTALVVLQFSVSIGLGVAALVVFRQIDYSRNLDLGFRRDNILITWDDGQLAPTAGESFAHALADGPGILGVARSNFTPLGGFHDVLPTRKPGDPQMYSPVRLAITPEFLPLYGIRIVAGRALSDKRGDDVYSYVHLETNEGRNVLINTAAARMLGYRPVEVVGKSFLFGKSHMTVVGVTTDALMESAGRTPISPTVYVLAPDVANTYSIRIQSGRVPEALAHVERVSRAFVPDAALSRTFLDANFEALYSADEKQGEIFSVFVTIAIIIACLGLFGLAAFTAERRTREIGVRKVFGARDGDVLMLLLRQFSTPVLLANLIAWPIAWYFLNGWLQGFAHRIDLNPLYFVGVGLGALLIAWITVFSHASRVARANPIHALRYE